MQPGFKTTIDPSNVSLGSASYITDFTDAVMTALSATPIKREYLEQPGASQAPIVNAVFSIQSLVLPTIDSGFGSTRSIGFQYRPFYTNGRDYNNTVGVASGLFIEQYTPTVILFNTRTKQSLFIRPTRFEVPKVKNAGTDTQYQPLSMNIQGVAPFFASPTDTIEICLFSPAISSIFGKLILNLFNFDVPPWYQTNVDALFPVT